VKTRDNMTVDHSPHLTLVLRGGSSACFSLDLRILPIALFVSLSIALADQPPRPLTSQEMKVLQRQITLGRRIVTALARYSKAAYELNGESANMWTRGINQLGLLTRTPTIEVLHAAGYINDSDDALARRYRATPKPVPADVTMAQPLLTMQSERGELVFDTRGDIALRQHQ
jgi:hypothetical protein